MPAVDLLVPGDIAAPTGGYIYDRRILAGLVERGWQARPHSLDESFPLPTPAALQAARRVLDQLAPGSLVLIDGLALAGLEPLLPVAARQLACVALIHHPLALETGLDPPIRRQLEDSERAALAWMRGTIVTSRWTARALEAYRVPRDRLHVVEPGTDVPRDGQSPASRAASEHVNLLSVATVTARKGHELLVDALAELGDRRWRLRCVGSLARDPQTVERVRRRIAELGLAGRIELVGELDAAALEREYRRADLFVLASHLEGYGMALAEALAHGLPIVSTTGGAIPETVPAAAGVLVPPGDRRALAAELGALLDDSERRSALAAGARAAAARLPSWDDAAAKLAATLLEIEPGKREQTPESDPAALDPAALRTRRPGT